MIDRRLSPTLSRRLNETPAVVLLGPRQAGKTTLLVNDNYTSPSGGADDNLDCNAAGSKAFRYSSLPCLNVLSSLTKAGTRTPLTKSILDASGSP